MNLFSVFQGDGDDSYEDDSSDDDEDETARAPVLPREIQKQKGQKQIEYLRKCLQHASKRVLQLHLFFKIDVLNCLIEINIKGEVTEDKCAMIGFKDNSRAEHQVRHYLMNLQIPSLHED